MKESKDLSKVHYTNPKDTNLRLLFVRGVGNHTLRNVEVGSIALPSGVEVEVLALNEKGLGVRFKAIGQ